MIKLILSDLTGVVLNGGFTQLTNQLSKKYGIESEEIYNVLYNQYYSKLVLGSISEQEVYQGTIDHFGFKESWQELEQMYLETYQLNPPMIELLKKLKDKFKLVLLTKNTSKYLQWKEKKFKFSSLFFDIINTSDIGLSKASRQTMEYVLKKYQVEPDEVIYIDDQEQNLIEAEKLGVKTIFYQSFAQVEKEILFNTNFLTKS